MIATLTLSPLPKTPEPPIQPEAKGVGEPTKEEAEFGGQVRFGKKGGLVGDSSLKKWAKKDDENLEN